MRTTLLMIVLVVTLLGQSACRSTLGKMYGIRETGNLREDSINITIAGDSLLQTGCNYLADTQYINQLYHRFRKDSLLYKDLMQPIQAMYFDTAGKLVSYHINRNAGGFPNLKWNRNNAFHTYPPLTQTPCFPEITLPVIEQAIRPLGMCSKHNTAKETVIVFWNYQFYKQSRRLLQLVKDNIRERDAKGDIRLLLVNTDMLYK